MHVPRIFAARGLTVLLTGTAVAATLVAGAARAQAATPKKIAGGVEDGTFSLSCVKSAVRPDTGVLRAQSYRKPLGDVVRILVPYNIATKAKRSSNEYQCFSSYLNAARRNHARVEVSLNRLGAHQNGPSIKTYLGAVNALAVHDGKRITYLTAWNEPNNPAYLANKGRAALGGMYFASARKADKGAFAKKLVAGDFASGVGLGFLRTYVNKIGFVPSGIWAIHPYTDVTNFQYYLHSGMSAAKAGAKAAAGSKVLQFSRDLTKLKGYSGARIWINEIYVDHRADKNPPNGVSGRKCTSPQDTTCTSFSAHNQDEAAKFISGGLGSDSLPGYLARSANRHLPQLDRFIYLRALADKKDVQKPDADVLQVHYRTCVYHSLIGTRC